MTHSDTPREILTVGPLEVYVDEELARVDGHAIVISGHTFGLLAAFARRPGEVVTREVLYRDVWGATLRPGDRSVDVILNKLRRALRQSAPGWLFIHTHPHRGYRLAPTLRSPPRAADDRSILASHGAGARLVVGPVEIVAPDLLVIVQGREIYPRARDMDVLVLLATNAGRVLSREAIFEAIWRRPLMPSDRSVDVAVGHLRSGLATPGWEFFHTHFRRGYRFEPVVRAKRRDQTRAARKGLPASQASASGSATA